MADLKGNYPHGLKDEEIEDLVNQYASELFKQKASTNAVLQFTPLIQLGNNELQSRQTKRVTRLSIGASFLSLLTAGMALYVSLTSSRSSDQWKEEQLRILSQMQESTIEANNTLVGTLREEMEKSRKETADNAAKIESLVAGAANEPIRPTPSALAD